jgi:2-haloacid dehalogenase
MSARLTNYKVLTFDCYGTLIDWEGGIWDALQPLLMANQRDDLSRRQGLKLFATHETIQEAATPDMLYPQMLGCVHASIAADLGIESSAQLDADFGASVPHWPAFADSAESLRYLKTQFRLVILSNVNRASFAASNRKLGVEFDAIYTAEDVGCYKPNPANFQYMLDHLHSDFGLAKDDVMHTAQSLHHDHRQARNFELANTWIDRQQLSKGGDWGATAKLDEVPKTDFLFYSMAELADAVRAELT